MDRRDTEDILVGTMNKFLPTSCHDFGALLTSRISLKLFSRDQKRIRQILLHAIPTMRISECDRALSKREHILHTNLWDLALASSHPMTFAKVASQITHDFSGLGPLELAVSSKRPVLLVTMYSGRMTMSSFSMISHVLPRHQIVLYMYLNPTMAPFWRNLVSRCLPEVSSYFQPIAFTRGREDRNVERLLLRRLISRDACIFFGFVDTILFPIGSPTIPLPWLGSSFETSEFLARIARTGDCSVLAFESHWDSESRNCIRYTATKLFDHASEVNGTEFNKAILGYAQNFVLENPHEWHSWHSVFHS